MFIRDVPVGSLFINNESKDSLFVLDKKEVPGGISLISLNKVENNIKLGTRKYSLEDIVGNAWTLVTNE